MPKQGVHVLQQCETTAKDTEGGKVLQQSVVMHVYVKTVKPSKRGVTDSKHASTLSEAQSILEQLLSPLIAIEDCMFKYTMSIHTPTLC